jgi:hypothetical protein
VHGCRRPGRTRCSTRPAVCLCGWSGLADHDVRTEPGGECATSCRSAPTAGWLPAQVDHMPPCANLARTGRPASPHFSPYLGVGECGLNITTAIEFLICKARARDWNRLDFGR